MDFATAMKLLEASGSEATRATYVRHGVTGPQFGVSYAALGKLTKQAGTDSPLAVELWRSGNHDARVLATMVADPATLLLAELDAWSKELSNKTLADAVGRFAARVPGAKETIVTWTKSPDEWIGRAGWSGVAALVAGDPPLPETELEGWISALEKGIHRTKNHVKDARIGLLISIGAVSDALEARALAVARRIGPIDVDHGDTACETPDALLYIPKARAHRRAKEQKGARARKAVAAPTPAATAKPPARAGAKSPATKVAAKARTSSASAPARAART